MFMVCLINQLSINGNGVPIILKLRLAKLKSHVYYISEANPKLRKRLKKLHKPEILSEDALQKNSVSAFF